MSTNSKSSNKHGHDALKTQAHTSEAAAQEVRSNQAGVAAQAQQQAQQQSAQQPAHNWQQSLPPEQDQQDDYQQYQYAEDYYGPESEDATFAEDDRENNGAPDGAMAGADDDLEQQFMARAQSLFYGGSQHNNANSQSNAAYDDGYDGYDSGDSGHDGGHPAYGSAAGAAVSRDEEPEQHEGFYVADQYETARSRWGRRVRATAQFNREHRGVVEATAADAEVIATYGRHHQLIWGSGELKNALDVSILRETVLKSESVSPDDALTPLNLTLASTPEEKDAARVHLAAHVYAPQQIFADERVLTPVSSWEKDAPEEAVDEYQEFVCDERNGGYENLLSVLDVALNNTEVVSRSTIAYIDYLQLHFPLANKEDQEQFNVILLALFAKMQEGDICINLGSLDSLFGVIAAWQEDMDNLSDRKRSLSVNVSERYEMLMVVKRYAPYTVQQVRDLLQRAIAVGTPEENNAPLIFDMDRLYLRRYYLYEKGIADYIRDAGALTLSAEQQEKLQQAIAVLFPPSKELEELNVVNWQEVAALMSTTSNFTVISGGPGTGKTTTVLRILLLLICLDPENRLIELCAPTGKAAARMGESILKQMKDPRTQETLVQLGRIFDLTPDELRSFIPSTAVTVQRLLKVIPNHATPIFNRDHRLICDVLVVDEVSMLDLALFYKLLQAVEPHCKLILLGDKDQLSSVEAGAVLAELCARLELRETQRIASKTIDFISEMSGISKERLLEGKIADHVALLQFSYRSKDVPEIGQLASLVNNSPSVPAGAAGAISAANRGTMPLTNVQEGHITEFLKHELGFGLSAEAAEPAELAPTSVSELAADAADEVVAAEAEAAAAEVADVAAAVATAVDKDSAAAGNQGDATTGSAAEAEAEASALAQQARLERAQSQEQELQGLGSEGSAAQLKKIRELFVRCYDEVVQSPQMQQVAALAVAAVMQKSRAQKPTKAALAARELAIEANMPPFKPAISFYEIANEKSLVLEAEIERLGIAIDEDMTWDQLNLERVRRVVARKAVEPGVKDNYAPFLEKLAANDFKVSRDPREREELFKLMDRFRLLCSNHSGALGDVALNEQIAAEVKRTYLRGRGYFGPKDFFPGQIIIITKNDPVLGLVNGYVGFCAYEEFEPAVMVAENSNSTTTTTTDGSLAVGSTAADAPTYTDSSSAAFTDTSLAEVERAKVLRVFIPVGVEEVDGESFTKVNVISTLLLTNYSTGYAMSIHKSQGSEYDKVTMVLADRVNRVLTKELVYTGITRAKKCVELVSSVGALLYAISHSVERESGLAARLQLNAEQAQQQQPQQQQQAEPTAKTATKIAAAQSVQPQALQTPVETAKIAASVAPTPEETAVRQSSVAASVADTVETTEIAAVVVKPKRKRRTKAEMAAARDAEAATKAAAALDAAATSQSAPPVADSAETAELVVKPKRKRRTKAEMAAAREAEAATQVAAAPDAAETSQSVPSVADSVETAEPAVKPKRKRRTKAEIAAVRAAEAAQAATKEQGK